MQAIPKLFAEMRGCFIVCTLVESSMNDGAETSRREAIEVFHNLVYATHEEIELAADAYVPSGPGPFAAIVLFHGGAWTKGSRAAYEAWGRFLASSGYVAIAVDYRLASADRSTFPQNVWDAKAAVQWVRANHVTLRVDPARLAVMGGSAGAHLAAMVALTTHVDELRSPYPAIADQPADVSVVIALAGPYDLLSQWEFDAARRPPGRNPAELYIGGTPMSERRRFFLASPTYHASTDNASGTRWLLAWGTEDEVVLPAPHSQTLSRQLQQAGALVRHAPLIGAPHYWYLESAVEESGSWNARFAPMLLGFLRTWSGFDGVRA